MLVQAAAASSGSYWSALASDVRILQMAVVGPSGREWPDSLNVFDTVWRERQVSSPAPISRREGPLVSWLSGFYTCGTFYCCC